MFLHNESIMLCGGEKNLKTCLKLQEGTWTEYTSMKRERDKAAVVSTTTATFIFGGWRNKDTYEYLENNAFEWKLGTANITDGFKSGLPYLRMKFGLLVALELNKGFCPLMWKTRTLLNCL